MEGDRGEGFGQNAPILFAAACACSLASLAGSMVCGKSWLWGRRRWNGGFLEIDLGVVEKKEIKFDSKHDHTEPSAFACNSAEFITTYYDYNVLGSYVDSFKCTVHIPICPRRSLSDQLYQMMW